MSDYDQRQYRLMLDRLTAFEQGKLRLDRLVDDLDGLLHALEEVDSPWKQTFLDNWGVLEDVRAYALDMGLTAFDDAMSQTLRAATDQLKLFVLQKIDDPADHPQRL